MKTYLDKGSVLVIKDDPHGTSIPKTTDNPRYREALAEVAAGEAEIVEVKVEKP